MMNNVLIIDSTRIKKSIMEDFGRQFLWMMDFVAIDNGDGTVEIVKNRFSDKTGIFSRNYMNAVLDGAKIYV